MGKLIDRTGEIHGRLTIISLDKIIKGNSYWNCSCECGNTKSIMYGSIKSGASNSCGCLHKELTSKRTKTHGESKTNNSEYRCWSTMKTRCINPNLDSYPNYGGRGIKVCDEWLNSFETFLKDMGRKPSKSHSIDRIDVNGSYCKENCKWSTAVEQNNNKTSNIKVIDTKTGIIYNTLSEAAKANNIKFNTLHYQLTRKSINETNLKIYEEL